MLTVQQVGRFELRDFLGRGALGDVYLAWDPEAQREVALKVVRANRADPEMLQAEKNGVALQRQLSSVAPQVAAVYEWGEDGPFFWVAMEYVAGDDLSQRLAHGPFPEDHAASIACQLCDMLEVCHNFSAEVGGRQVYGIIHGDIKPENIRLQDEDRVRVLDFGIAKHLSQTRKFTVNLFGSLPYTPPERLERGGVDRHSDLWAVGVVLYMCVAGYSPFEGEEPEEVEGKIRRGEPPKPLPPDVSPALGRIIVRSLAFQVARRYATAAEMKGDLEAWHRSEPLPGEQSRPEEPGESREDLNATRRTSRPLSLDDSGISETRRTDRFAAPRDEALEPTRRTGDAVAVLAPPPPAMPEEPPPAPPPTRRRRFAMRYGGLLLLLIGSFLLASQVWVHSEAQAMTHELATQTAPDLDSLWDRYRKLAPFSLPGSGLGDVRDELRTAMIKSADRTLNAYHGDDPVSTVKGWQKAHDRLQAAVDLNYRDRPTRAKMLYAQGHLDRIAAQKARSARQADEARQKVRDAVDEYQDAAKLAPDWPDPYLGLAHVYAYEQPDLKQLEGTINELEHRGYTPGRREKAMLADGYRAQAEQVFAQARAAQGTDQEQELLERSRDTFTQAIGLYREAGNFADAKANMTNAAQELRGILSRLEELGVW
ncbi:MAG TPA: serine/threonine-protein kinase [Thermoanaerobaculia bacterium]|jgi:serine/threonine protein kinase